MCLNAARKARRKCTYCARSFRDLEIVRERTWSGFNALWIARDYGTIIGKERREKRRKKERERKKLKRKNQARKRAEVIFSCILFRLCVGIVERLYITTYSDTNDPKDADAF